MEGRVTWFPLGSILLTREAESENEYSEKEKSPLFFNLIYYWLSPKNCYSLNEIIALVLRFSLPFPSLTAKLACGGAGWAQWESASICSCPSADVSGGILKQKKIQMTCPEILWKKISRNKRGGAVKERKLKISLRNRKAWRHNFLIGGQQMCPRALAYWSLCERSFDGG